MRIWCLPVTELDRQGLLGEHFELHRMLGALLGRYTAYRNHPQTLRFENRLAQLVDRYNQQVAEMQRRGYTHNSIIEGTAEPYVYTDEEYRRDHADLMQRVAARAAKAKQREVT